MMRQVSDGEMVLGNDKISRKNAPHRVKEIRSEGAKRPALSGIQIPSADTTGMG
jgi:hypothetical protein